MANLGAINWHYEGDLNDQDPDTPRHPAPAQMYAYLLSRGATKGEAMMLTGAAASESEFNPTVGHDGGKGYGMFGHNGGRLIAMRQYASTSGQDLADWRTQSQFALNELRSRPEGKAAANATTPEQLALAQMYFERPQGFTEANPEAGHNYTGRLNTLRAFTRLDPNAAGAFAPSANPAIGPEQAAAAGLPAPASGHQPAALGGGGALGGVASVGDPTLNAALAKLLEQSRQNADGTYRKPLISQLIGTVTHPIRDAMSSGLSSLLGSVGSTGQTAFGANPTPPSEPAPQAGVVPPPAPTMAGVAPGAAPSLAVPVPAPQPYTAPFNMMPQQPASAAIAPMQGGLPVFAQARPGSLMSSIAGMFGGEA